MISQAIAANKVAPAPSRPVKGSPILIRSVAELERFQAEWLDLMAPEASPFQTFSWNRAWYRNFSDCFDEVIIFVGSRRASIFPLYRKGKTLRFAGDLTCDYQDAIAKNIQNARLGFQELRAWALRNGYSFNFQKLSTRGFLYQILTETPKAKSFFDPLEKAVGPCPYVELGETSETRLAHLPRKFRAELRRQMRRITSDFPGTELQFHKTPAISEGDVLGMLKFHSDNFRFSGSNPLDDPRLRQMLLEVRDQPEVGLCVSRLGNEGTTMAMDLAFIRGDRFYGYLTAFNCDQARYSPGSCLLTSRLDLLAEKEGVKVLDFLCGSEPYKYRFAKDEYVVCSIRLVPRTFAGGMNIFQLKSEYFLRRFVKRILTALKLR